MTEPWWWRIIAAICTPRRRLSYGPTEQPPPGSQPVTGWPSLLGEQPPWPTHVEGAGGTWGLESGRRVDEPLGGDGWGLTDTPPHVDPHR